MVIDEDLLADIDTLVGKRGRSAFLAEVLQKEVRRRKLMQFLDDPRAGWKDKDHPELKDGAAAWVSRLRAKGEQALKKKLGGRVTRD